MSSTGESFSAVAAVRAARGWTQTELSRRTGIPRTTISAIEGSRLTPSVTTALELARVLECSVESLFLPGQGSSQQTELTWAFPPADTSCRFWDAEIGGRTVRFPVEGPCSRFLAHDGIGSDREPLQAGRDLEANTLVMASCDPAAGLLAREYEKFCGFRLIVLQRGGEKALDLLQNRVVHLAGLHCSTLSQPDRNQQVVRTKLGQGFHLMRWTRWEEGLVVARGGADRSVTAALKRVKRWALREPGSAARECLDQVVGARSIRGRVVSTHQAVAEAVRFGWAEGGVCVRLAAEQAQVRFHPIRTEVLDLCLAADYLADKRVTALIRMFQDRGFRRLMSELPGYNCGDAGELLRLS